MNKWYLIFQRNTGLNPYVWLVFCILPFYFIFRSSNTLEVAGGIILVVLFFLCYRLAFVSKGWKLYFWTSVQLLISITMSLWFDYVYFALFLAYFIGNIENRAGFLTMYVIHLVSVFVTMNYGFASFKPVFISQFPFIFINLLVVILLPFNIYNRNKQGKLEGQLEDANKRISDLMVMEERQRIARDLHDTLGQKLSLIGLKSDLASKLTINNPEQAKLEMKEVQQTARVALKEVRELVTEMRGTKLEDEIHHVRQILGAAGIEAHISSNVDGMAVSLLTENVLSMCLKEAVTNVVKHSQATICWIHIEQSANNLTLVVKDNGTGIKANGNLYNFKGSGIRGIRERLEFVNGTLDVRSDQGLTLAMQVPIVFIQRQGGERQG
ncbi:sensor histidine kinase [Cohnella sp. AR92]|uniref:sensor histidine kinase n=1 Tax=Cohnella sp. AR92 TaxID=648716 RepID=UPI000F8F0C38|nr:sensor histidine kinase [Cohnella sp. AR92]RUS47025.1 sensor histidine kinase [Cohnella sp. AR92]